MCDKEKEAKIEKEESSLSLIFKTLNSNSTFFDYTNKTVITVYHTSFDKIMYYYRVEKTNIINKKENQTDIENSNTILFKARKSRNGYYELILPIAKLDSLDINNLNNLDNKMWLLQRTTKNNSKIEYENRNGLYYLQKNDLIRIGDQKFEIIELNLNSANSKSKESEDSNKKTEDSNIVNQISESNKKFGSVFETPKKEAEKKEEKTNNNEEGNNKNELKKKGKEKKEKKEKKINLNIQCKSCGSSEYNDDNLLLKMCKCDDYIHFNCLKKIFIVDENCQNKTNNNYTKNEKSNENCKITSYKIENFNCKHCGTPYPLRFDVCITKDQNETKSFCFIDKLIPPKNKNYMILESTTYIQTKERNNTKRIYVIELSDKEVDKEVMIGRREDNDIVIDSCQGISGHHAILTFYYKTGKVSIINEGKFGTCVLIKNKVKLNPGQSIYFQVGNSYIKAEVKGDYEIKENIKKEEEKKEEERRVEENEENDDFQSNTIDDVSTTKIEFK